MASNHRPEIVAAAEWLASHIPQSASRQTFTDSLIDQLTARCKDHWHTDDPERASALRCLTRSGTAVCNLDSLVMRALSAAGYNSTHAAAYMASSMQAETWTLWIDPGCVAFRSHDAASLGGNASANAASGGVFFDTGVSTTSKPGPLSGIKEIWGQLPASLVAAHDTPLLQHRTRTPSNPAADAASDDNDTYSISAALQAEFADLIVNASPSKRSKAIAIVRPPTAASTSSSSSSHSRSTTVASDVGTISAMTAPAATPPRPPLPPLAFTIQESTSPYVPSFTSMMASASSATTPTPLAPSPSPLSVVYTLPECIDSPDMSSPSLNEYNVNDPFMRPSSRSSTGSVESSSSVESMVTSSSASSSSAARSAESCSVFSHASSESHSSVGSLESPGSDGGISYGPASLMGMVAKATHGEAEQAKAWTFPGSGLVAPSSIATNGVFKCPPSPAKQRRSGHSASVSHVSRHGHTLSTSSATSVLSSGNTDSKHGRTKSSQSNIRVAATAGTVQDYSNGKVGVLGGGVLLGSAGSSSSSGDAADRRDRRGRGNSSGHSKTLSTSSNLSNGSAAPSSSNDATTRPKSRSRNPSLHSANGASQSWYPQTHQYHGQYHNQHFNAPSMPPMPNHQHWATYQQ